MLSSDEKKEMLKDAQNPARRAHFQQAGERGKHIPSFDAYIAFLNSIQKIFGPFKIPADPTSTTNNKL